jgi:hypothetical protein
MKATIDRGLPHSSHWGAFSVLLREEGIEIVPHPRDADPSALLGNIPASGTTARVSAPLKIMRLWTGTNRGACALARTVCTARHTPRKPRDWPQSPRFMNVGAR